MLANLRQIFDKKSPLFLINIILFISTLVAITFQTTPTACSNRNSIKLFEIILIIVFGCQILAKTLGINLIHYCSQSGANLPHLITIVGFLVIDFIMWIAGCILFWEIQHQDQCIGYEPHRFMLSVYICLSGVIFLGVFLLLIGLKLENKVITVFDRASHQEQQ